MHGRLSHQMHTNNILATEHYSFRKDISTEDATFRLTDSAFKFINQDKHVGGIFCDVAKAFDCVNNEILLVELHFYGFQGLSENWFMSYLTNRGHKVEVKSPNSTKNFFSDWGTLKYGIPQGSNLGSCLFIIQINNLPLTINSASEPVLFDDDTSVIISSRNFEDFCSMANLVLSRMIKWFTANNLVINFDKMNIMKFITKNSSHFTLQIGYKEKYIK